MDQNTNRIISEAVDAVTEAGIGQFGKIQGLLSELEEARSMISDLELRMNHVVEQMVASLGAEVRNRQPRIEIGLRNGQAHCGYRSRSIVCKPNVSEGIWEISGTPFAKTFVKTYPHLMQMGEDIQPLAHAIADFFNDRYRSLNR